MRFFLSRSETYSHVSLTLETVQCIDLFIVFVVLVKQEMQINGVGYQKVWSKWQIEKFLEGISPVLDLYSSVKYSLGINLCFKMCIHLHNQLH